MCCFLGRVAIGFWWFFSFIVFSWYIANLVAFSSAERLVAPIETFEDLARQTDIRYGVLYGGSTMAFFNQSTRNDIKNMWNSMLQYKDDVFVRSTQEGIEKVRRSRGKKVHVKISSEVRALMFSRTIRLFSGVYNE